ncbi:hypothetical protein BDR26DRAFT_871877 [Obelidium mucronatum]|nr:hypothetical protein BDR26DRAFT_871877 [Obelidium mucronatum]
MSQTLTIQYFKDATCSVTSLYEYVVQPGATEFVCTPKDCEPMSAGGYQTVDCNPLTASTAEDFLSTAKSLFSKSTYSSYVVLKEYLRESTCSNMPYLFVAAATGVCMDRSHLGSNVKARLSTGQVTVSSCLQNVEGFVPGSYTFGSCLPSANADVAGLYFQFDYVPPVAAVVQQSPLVGVAAAVSSSTSTSTSTDSALSSSLAASPTADALTATMGGAFSQSVVNTSSETVMSASAPIITTSTETSVISQSNTPLTSSAVEASLQTQEQPTQSTFTSERPSQEISASTDNTTTTSTNSETSTSNIQSPSSEIASPTQPVTTTVSSSLETQSTESSTTLPQPAIETASATRLR